MKQELTAYIKQAMTTIILMVAGLTPLIVAPLTTDFFDMPKVIFLIAAILVLLILWSLSWIIQGKVIFTRTPLDIPLLLLLVIVIISTFFSETRAISILGNIPKVHGSATTFVAYILFFFIAVSNLKTLKDVKALIYVLLVSGIILSVISILSFFGIYLPISFAQGANFSPAGSSFSTAAFLVLLLPILMVAIIAPSQDLDYSKLADDPIAFIKKYFKNLVTPNFLIPPSIAIVLLTLFGATIALIGDLSTQIAAAAAVILVILTGKRNQIEKSISILAIPVGISILIFALGILSQNGSYGIFSEKFSSFPREIQLPFDASWKVSASSFRDAPFWGTGPATYLYNFTTYKPAEMNSTKFWNIRFDSAHNEFLQILGTLGGLGLLAFLFTCIMVVAVAIRGLKSQYNHNLTLPLSLSAVLTIILFAFHPTTPTSIIASLTVFAMLMAIHKTITGKVEELQLGIKASKLTDSSLIVGDVLPMILFIPILLFVVVVAWRGGKIVLADYYHRMALNSAQTQAINTYNYLVQAETLNPDSDLYRTDLAQTNFALANAIAINKGPSEASPAGSLTDQDKANIQTLLSQAINEGRAATVLAPRSAQNWEILAALYRQIAGVAQNALVFSLDAYGKAIQRDPFNPVLRLNVGGVYYSVRAYDLAIRFFSDAIVLKPDYANAYYNLSVAYRDKGDLNTAVQAGQQMLTLIDPKSPDYQTAQDYLKDLQTKASGGTTDNPEATPPAAQTNSALGKEELPKVVELGEQPDNVATPAALRRNGNQVQEVSPTPSPSGFPAASATPGT
jgi:O-antigen ligase/tetratricopeptide (TPR) repeat protein